MRSDQPWYFSPVNREGRPEVEKDERECKISDGESCPEECHEVVQIYHRLARLEHRTDIPTNLLKKSKNSERELIRGLADGHWAPFFQPALSKI